MVQSLLLHVCRWYSHTVHVLGRACYVSYIVVPIFAMSIALAQKSFDVANIDSNIMIDPAIKKMQCLTKS